MKIILINYLRLNELPPAISLLKRINTLGGIYISLYDEDKYKDMFCNIEFLHVYDKKTVYDGSQSLREKIKYKISDFRRNRASSRIFRYIDDHCDLESLIWFLHESTVLSLGKKIEKYNHYFISLYELDAAQRDKSGKLSAICQKADCIIVPEETRAHIIKAFLSLPKKTVSYSQ